MSIVNYLSLLYYEVPYSVRGITILSRLTHALQQYTYLPLCGRRGPAQPREPGQHMRAPSGPLLVLPLPQSHIIHDG